MKASIERLNQYTSLLTLLVTTIGLIFVGLQLRDGSEDLNASLSSLRVSSGAQEYQALAQIDLIMIEHPDIRPYFVPEVDANRADWHDLQGENRQRVLAVAEAYLDFMDYQPGFGPSGDSDAEAWRAYYVALLRNSPVIRELLSGRCGMYDFELWDDYWGFRNEFPEICPVPH